MHRLEFLPQQAPFAAVDQQQPLLAAQLQRRHQAAALGQLRGPGRRQVLATGGGDDAFVGCGAGVAQTAVAEEQPQVAVAPAGPLQRSSGVLKPTAPSSTSE